MCNDIITHVQANNRITALQLQHYQRQTSSSLYSPCQCFRRPMHLMSASWFVSELSCQRVDCQRVDVSASWFVSELSCQRVDCQQVNVSASWFVSELSCQRADCQRVGLSSRCLSPTPTSCSIQLSSCYTVLHRR